MKLKLVTKKYLMALIASLYDIWLLPTFGRILDDLHHWHGELVHILENQFLTGVLELLVIGPLIDYQRAFWHPQCGNTYNNCLTHGSNKPYRRVMKCTCIITSDDFIVRIGTIKLQPCKPHISGSLFFFSSAACVVLRHCSPRRIFLGYCLFLLPAQTPMRGVGKIRGIGKLVHTPPVPKRRQSADVTV